MDFKNGSCVPCTIVEGGPTGEDPERIYNYVRLVRDSDSGTVVPPEWAHQTYLPLVVKQ